MKKRDGPRLMFEGREYPLMRENGYWRMRSKAKTHPADFRTGFTSLKHAKTAALAWLRENVAPKIRVRGTVAEVAEEYLRITKKASDRVAKNNVSAMKSLCRELGAEIDKTPCRDIGPEWWEKAQRKLLADAKLPFSLTARPRVNIAINSRVRAARSLFLPKLHRHYKAAGIVVRPDSAEVVELPEPYVPPEPVNDAALIEAWHELKRAGDERMWRTIGLARFAGLRRNEIAAVRVEWLQDGAFSVHDYPYFQHKVGKPYTAEIIDPGFREWVYEFCRNNSKDTPLVPDPPPGTRSRGYWFMHAPPKWLKSIGVVARQPLHRLRKTYATELAKLTRDAVLARQAGIAAAQQALGHTSIATTEKHYIDHVSLR